MSKKETEYKYSWNKKGKGKVDEKSNLIKN